MKSAIFLILLMVPLLARAEGGCPPGQYPIGGQGVQGCAPIPGQGGGSGASPAPRPTGKWEDRWGGIASDASVRAPGVEIPTGISESKLSKREAVSSAMSQCEKLGGKKCKMLVTYYNQCAALADPTVGGAGPPGRSAAGRAEKKGQAESLAVAQCEKVSNGRSCSVVYSGCSMSEFKAF
jgi:hypothetical protein